MQTPQITNDNFHRTRKKILNHMEILKTPTRLNNPEKEKQNWRNQAP